MDLKALALESGVDLCGIAPVERFTGAPIGFHPVDIYPDCKSVLAFAKRLPSGVLEATTCIPYTFATGKVLQELEQITVDIARKLDDEGIQNVPIPPDDPYEHWESARLHGQGILSMRHAAWLAGIGVLGKNTLLITPQFGNMVQLGAILLGIDVEGDPLLSSEELCIPSCRLCLDSCPQGALTGDTVIQELCRPLTCFTSERGFCLKKCYECRRVCPHALGVNCT